MQEQSNETQQPVNLYPSIPNTVPISYQDDNTNEQQSLLQPQQVPSTAFSVKHMLLTICSKHLYLSICVRKNKEKDAYTTLRRLIFALFCVMCSLCYLIFSKQVSMIFDICCTDARCFSSCEKDHPIDGMCTTNYTYIPSSSVPSTSAVKGLLYVFHYEYAETEEFEKCAKSKFCTTYCSNSHNSDFRPECTPQNQNDLLCVKGEEYCHRAKLPLFGALLSGMFAFILFYPSKLLLSCTLKITARGKICNNVCGIVWSVFVVFWLLFVVLFWVLTDISMISYYHVFFGTYWKQFLWILKPFAISLVTGFIVDFVVQFLLYFTCMKWKRGEEEKSW